MWEAIVLGQVPGTTLQVSFETWLAGMTVLGLIVAVFRVRRHLRRMAYLTWISLSLRLSHPRIRPVSA